MNPFILLNFDEAKQIVSNDDDCYGIVLFVSK